MLDLLTGLSEFQSLCERINDTDHTAFGSLGLLRSARYLTAAALYESLKRPVLYLTDRPGVLLDIASAFVKYHINIAQISSKMVNNNSDEQAVFIDFDGHEQDENIQALLKELEPIARGMRIIGSYTQF